MLRKILTPPIPYEGESFFEEANYVLAYRMSLFLSLTLGSLSLVFLFFFDLSFVIFTFAAFLSILIGFFVIYNTGKYRATMLCFNIIAALLCQITMYAIPNTPHLADGFWMIVSIVFSFLTIKTSYAVIISVFHTISTFVFYALFYNKQILLIKLLNQEQLFGFGLNIMFSFSILAYLTWQNIHTTKIAEQKLKNANNKLYSNNEEITLMLKEIHHRVKNNLQVIISLLRLQSNELENEEAIEKFNDTIHRVVSMAAIHEKMYQSKELTKLDLNEYFFALGQDMIRSYNSSNEISLEVNCTIQTNDLKAIVPIGLLFNELISNSLKHAFAEGEKGEIKFMMNRQNDGLVIIYTDSGTWKESTSKSSFGHDLMETLVDQLNGTIQFSKNPTTYCFEFSQIDL